MHVVEKTPVDEAAIWSRHGLTQLVSMTLIQVVPLVPLRWRTSWLPLLFSAGRLERLYSHCLPHWCMTQDSVLIPLVCSNASLHACLLGTDCNVEELQSHMTRRATVGDGGLGCKLFFKVTLQWNQVHIETHRRDYGSLHQQFSTTILGGCFKPSFAFIHVLALTGVTLKSHWLARWIVSMSLNSKHVNVAQNCFGKLKSVWFFLFPLMVKLSDLNHFRRKIIRFEPLRPSDTGAYGTKFYQFKLVCTSSSFSLWLQRKKCIT